MKYGRRQFLGTSIVTASGVFVFGCEDDSPMANPDGGTPFDMGFAQMDSGAGVDAGQNADAGQNPDAGEADTGAPDAGEDCADPFEGGSNIGRSSFVGEGQPMDVLVGSGLGGRLFTDLSTVDPNDGIVENDRFYVRTFYPPTIDPNAPWEITASGLVNQQRTFTLADIQALVVDQGRVLLECSGNFREAGNGMISTAEWRGAHMQDVLDLIDISPSATRVLISGFDYIDPIPRNIPGASWIFTFDELNEAGAFLATEMNGVPLPDIHGFPIRLVVPGWYGCTNIKWVNEIILVDEDEPSTAQMREFAFRTHQSGTPNLARDFIPAVMDQAAMPIRIEKWRVDGEIRYKVVGILWGGAIPTNALSVRFGSGAWAPVDVCPAVTQNRAWSFWSHEWRPSSTGTFAIRCRIDDNRIRTRRLDVDRYLREVFIDEV